MVLFEYLLQVPANRAGYGQFDLGQPKIMQEIIALTVFVPFALYYMFRRPLGEGSMTDPSSSGNRTVTP